MKPKRMKRNRFPLKDAHAKILADRQGGMSVAKLASAYSVSRQAVYDVLKKMEKEGATIPWHKRAERPKRTRACAVCGNEFPARRNRKTCSDACLDSRRQKSPWSRTLLDLVCFHCGKQFKRTRFQQTVALKRSPEKKDFCSPACNIMHLQGRKTQPQTELITWDERRTHPAHPEKT